MLYIVRSNLHDQELCGMHAECTGQFPPCALCNQEEDEMEKIQLDARGCACPEPVLKVKRAVEQPHEEIEILVDNNTAVQNITRFAKNKGYGVSVIQRDDDFQLSIMKMT